MFIHDPINNPLLDLAYLKAVVYPALNSIALILAVVGILGSRFILNRRRLEALFAIVPITVTFFAYSMYWLGVFNEEARSLLVRAVFPVFLLSPAINSLTDLYNHYEGKYRAWASTSQIHKPKH